jgi:hypothetical protein
MMRDYRVSQGVSRGEACLMDLILVTCQECGTELVFANDVRLEDIGNAVTAHEVNADDENCQPQNKTDPFRKVLDYVEHGDAVSLVDAVLNIVYAHADKADRATMITSAVDKYRGVES